MRFKIQPDKEGGLCGTCRNAQVVEFSNGKRETHCGSGGGRPVPVLRPVTRCSDYDDKTQPSEYQMEKIAWVVTTDRKGQTIGFRPPRKQRDDD